MLYFQLTLFLKDERHLPVLHNIPVILFVRNLRFSVIQKIMADSITIIPRLKSDHLNTCVQFLEPRIGSSERAFELTEI